MLVAFCVMLPSFVKFDESGRTHNVGLLNPTSLGFIGMAILFVAMILVITLMGREKLIQRPVHFAGWLWAMLFINFAVATLFSPAYRLTAAKVTDLPISFFRLGDLVLLLVLVLSAYSREEEERATDFIIRVVGLTCWANIALVWLFLPILPSHVYAITSDVGSSHARLGGSFLNPVYLSVHAGIGFFYALFFFPRKWSYVCCPLALITLLLTYARSEQLLFAIALFAYLVVISRNTFLRWAGILTAASVCLLAAAFYDKVFSYLERGQGLRNITTLSERTDVWRASMQAFWLRPYLGYGFSIGVKNAIKDHWNATNWIPPHSHSEFVQALVTGGVLAGVLIVMIYIRVLWSSIRQAGRDAQHMFLLIALLQVFGMAFITPLVSGGHGPVSSMFVLIYIGVVAGERKQPSRRRAPATVWLSHPPAARPLLRWRQRG